MGRRPGVVGFDEGEVVHPNGQPLRTLLVRDIHLAMLCRPLLKCLLGALLESTGQKLNGKRESVYR